MFNKVLIPATSFVDTMSANVDNEKMSDSDFRQFVRNTLPIVDYPLNPAKNVKLKRKFPLKG